MQEYAVTIAGNTYPLPRPFLCWPPKTPSNRKELIRCQRHSSIVLCSISFGLPFLSTRVKHCKNTTADVVQQANKTLTAEEIVTFQHLVRRVPIADNVVEYAVKLSQSTRPGKTGASSIANDLLEWGAKYALLNI